MAKVNPNARRDKNKLDNPERVEMSAASDPRDCCDKILERLNNGLPVILTAGTGDTTDQPASEELQFISDFISDLSIDFIEYKRIMDTILNSAAEEAFREEDSLNTGTAVSDFVQPSGKAGPRPPFEIDPNEKIMLGSPLFSTTHAYRLLRYATEKYLRMYFGLRDIPPTIGETLPYIALVEAKLEGINFTPEGKVRHYRPILLELIWSYWHEEGMVVQTINAIARRFQNVRSGYQDPLGNLEIHPLRPLNNILWGYIQDTINRLTPARRAYEYNHHYGITLLNARNIAPADSRSYFIQSFHNLLNKCAIFYREADNLIKVPDALPVLNALREVHLQLAEGAHNQFGDLPLTSRVEMLVEQYILSRPEMRDFLGGRVMVPHEEPWMDIVDTMKSLQGWNRANTTYFRDLAVFGEQILLTIRWISWSQINNRNIARAWALLFRDAIQRYIHSYQAVTGLDLSAINVAGGVTLRSLMPAVLIRRKLQRDIMMMRRR